MSESDDYWLRLAEELDLEGAGSCDTVNCRQCAAAAAHLRELIERDFVRREVAYAAQVQRDGIAVTGCAPSMTTGTLWNAGGNPA